MLETAAQRSATVNHFESGRTCNKRLLEFGTIEKQEITSLLVALKSWTNQHPHPVGFQTGKMGMLQGLIQGMVGPWVIKVPQ